MVRKLFEHIPQIQFARILCVCSWDCRSKGLILEPILSSLRRARLLNADIIVAGQRELFGDANGVSTTTDDAKSFLRRALGTDSNVHGILVATLLSDDIWPVTESRQIYDFFLEKMTRDRWHQHWALLALEHLQDPGRGPVDPERLNRFVQHMDEDLSNECIEWLASKVLPQAITKPYILPIMLQHSFKLPRYTAEREMSQIVELACTVGRWCDGKTSAAILGWRFADAKERLELLAGILAGMVLQDHGSKLFPDGRLAGNFCDGILNYVFWPECEDDEWRRLLADLLWLVQSKLYDTLGAWYASWEPAPTFYVATWYLGVAFRSVDGKGTIGGFDIVDIVKSRWEPNLRHLFGNQLEVIAFANGFQATEEQTRWEPPRWVVRSVDLEPKMCAGELWSMATVSARQSNATHLRGAAQGVLAPSSSRLALFRGCGGKDLSGLVDSSSSDGFGLFEWSSSCHMPTLLGACAFPMTGKSMRCLLESSFHGRPSCAI